MQAVKFAIRQATSNDNEIIAKLSVACWQQAYLNIVSPEFLAQLDWQQRATGRKEFYQQNKLATGFIAELDGQAVGFCDAGPARPVEKLPAINHAYGEIYAVYVLQEFQKRGIGASLCQAACEYLIQQGCVRCVIWTLVENVTAMKFYEAIRATRQAWRKVNIIDGKAQNEIAFTIDLL